MRIWYAELLLALLMALGLTLALLKPRPSGVMVPKGNAESVASEVAEVEALPAQSTVAATGDLPAAPMAEVAAARARPGVAFQREAAPTVAAVELRPAVTISQDVPTANVPVPDAAARPQDELEPPPGMEPGNGPPPGPPPDDDDMGPPPGGGPPPGAPQPN